MEIFKIPYPDDFFDEDDIIKYPLSSTTNTNSSMNDIEVSQRQMSFVWVTLSDLHLRASMMLVGRCSQQ